MIKEIVIKKATSPDGKLRAYVKLILTNGFIISDIKIIEIKGELRVGFPAEKKQYKDKVKFYPIVRVEKSIKEKVVKAILDKYREV